MLTNDEWLPADAAAGIKVSAAAAVSWWIDKGAITNKTRMVQLPATTAIEYVAAGHFFPGGLLSGGLMPVPPISMLSVPSMIYVYPAGGRIQLT